MIQNGSLKRAIFIDRDGVINKSLLIDGKAHAPLKFSEFKILENVDLALTKFRELGFLNIIITNQPNLSSKERFLEKAELDLMHQFLMNNFEIDKIYVCPHLKTQNCFCRKPKIGNLLLAASEFNIDLNESYFVGDRWQDVECAFNAKLKGCFFIDYNYNERKIAFPFTKVFSLLDAFENLNRVINDKYLC